jgi:hypothetical protein
LNRAALGEVTLCAVTSIAVPETIASIKRCLEHADFGEAIFLSDQDPELAIESGIEWRKIPRIQDHRSYSHFILRDLAEHVTHPHVLVVQWDGFIIDGSRWQDDFLDYDYIGAPWPQFKDGQAVGNGGFSLRSRRLLEQTASTDFPLGHPEDLHICRTQRALLEREGIKFAPSAVAERFAYERGPVTESFGFHGLFNFAYVLDDEELRKTVGAIDPRLLGGRDGADLALDLCHRGRRLLAWRVAMRRRVREPLRPRNLRFWTKLLRSLMKPGRGEVARGR